MQPTVQTSIPTISSVRRTADCLCAHDSVGVAMGSDFTRHCARLVIRIARSSSPSNVLPFHRMTLLCMFTIIQVVNTLLAVIVSYPLLKFWVMPKSKDSKEAAK